MSATAGLVSCFESDSAGARIVVCTVFESVVSAPPLQVNTRLPRLTTVAGAPELTRAWNVTEPAEPAGTVPRLTATTPFPAATRRPTSPSAASVWGTPLKRIVPAM